MLDWKHQLGHEFIKKGALTYIISDEGTADLNGEEEVKQLADMIVFYKDHLKIIELKETTNTYRKTVSYKQVSRYQHLREDFKGRTEFWVFVYWNQYGYITGSYIRETDSLNFFAKPNGLEAPTFILSIGIKENERVEKKVDYVLKVKPGEIAPVKSDDAYAL